LALRRSANDEESEAGKRGGEKYKGKEELGTQAKIAGAVTQKVCDRAAGQEPGAELVVRHRASRLRKEGISTNGPEVPFSTVLEVTIGKISNHLTY